MKFGKNMLPMYACMSGTGCKNYLTQFIQVLCANHTFLPHIFQGISFDEVL